MIYAVVKERDLSVRTSSPITSGSVGIKMEVNLDHHWTSLYKYIIVQAGDNKITLEYNNGIVTVPHEVLTSFGIRLRIGIYGTNDLGDIVIPTIWNSELIIYEGASLSNDPGAEPTPTIVTRMNNEIAGAISTANEAMAIAEDTESTVNSAMNWLYEHGMPSGDVPIVNTFNGRRGSVALLSQDVSAVLTKQMLLDFIHPIGSYYVSSVSTSPETLFGGTWEQIKDRFILAAGDVYSAGDIGGEAEHTLTAGELPKLSGSTPNIFTGGQSGGTSGIVTHTVSSNRQYTTNGTSTNSWQSYAIAFGDNQPHNNMPPYLVAYVWHRIA